MIIYPRPRVTYSSQALISPSTSEMGVHIEIKAEQGLRPKEVIIRTPLTGSDTRGSKE
jgi:hypothetical protein